MRHYGVSVEKIEEALKAIEFPGVKTVQIVFNIFRQRPSGLLFREAAARDVGILARVPLASGLLTGKMTLETAFAATDHRVFQPGGGPASTAARPSPASPTRPGWTWSRNCGPWCRRGRRWPSSPCAGSSCSTR